MGKLTTRLLKKAARIAELAHDVQSELTEAFEERYGITYSDIDADELIDILDYGGGEVDLSKADRVMADKGYPPLSRAALQQAPE